MKTASEKHTFPIILLLYSIFCELPMSYVQNNLEITKEMSKKYAIHPHKLKTCGISC